MLSPERTIIETGVDYGARISVPKTSYPGKPVRIFTFEELAEYYRANLLKGLGEIALKILGKPFPLALFNCVTAKLDDLKISQVFYAIHGFVSRILIGLSKRRSAEGDRCNCC